MSREGAQHSAIFDVSNAYMAIGVPANEAMSVRRKCDARYPTFILDDAEVLDSTVGDITKSKVALG